jgi:hypothetical protein
MLLGRRAHGADDAIRYVIEYDNWLLPGESLTSGTVELNDEFTATVTDITITDVHTNSSNELVFTLTGGSVEEIFTLDVQIVNSRDEIKNDTVEFFIVAP